MERIQRLFQEGARLLLALVKPTAKSVRENTGLAALSLVLAFALWIFVTDTENPTRTGVLPLDLTIEPVNMAGDVVVASELVTVRPRVRVAQNVWESLTPADFKALVDLDSLRPGLYELPVKLTTVTSRGGLRVIEAVPSQIEVQLEPMFSKSVPVVVDVGGEPPAGFSMEPPEPEKAAVLVTGPQAKVDMVSQVVGLLDVAGRTESVRQAVRLEARDQRGFLVRGVTVDPSVTKVVVRIEPTQFSRTLTIAPQVYGTPAQGYNVVGASVSPATVTIFGSQSLIETTLAIRTTPVDISGAVKDVVRTVPMDLPPGASVSGDLNVTVTVEIEAASGQMAFVVPVNAVGLGEGLGIVGALPSVQVVLLGPLPTLLALRPTDIIASLDLSGLKAGAHTVKVNVKAPSGLQVTSTSPEEIPLLLEARQP